MIFLLFTAGYIFIGYECVIIAIGAIRENIKVAAIMFIVLTILTILSYICVMFMAVNELIERDLNSMRF